MLVNKRKPSNKNLLVAFFFVQIQHRISMLFI